jgi:hypothetical protein
MGRPMINLRGVANSAVQAINPNITGTFYASAGFTINSAKKQVPTYADGVNVAMQVQAVDARELRHLEGLNIQGVLRSVHMYGNTQGVVRPNQQGGDLLYFLGAPAGTLRVWKVVKVVETWPTWCHVIVNMQSDAAPPSPPPP